MADISISKIKEFRGKLNSFLRFSVFNPTYIPYRCLKRRFLKDRAYFKGVLIDVGCGNKPYYKYIKPMVDKYFGVEVFTTYADINRNVDVLSEHFVMPFKDDCCDTILMSQVLEHTYEPVRLLSTVRRLLKKDGHLVLTVPQTSCVHEMPYDYFRYTPFSLEKIFNDAGYEVVSIERVNTFGEMLTVIALGYLGRKLQYSKGIVSYLLKAVFIIPFVVILNVLGLVFGPLLRDDKETLDYRVIARRK